MPVPPPPACWTTSRRAEAQQPEHRQPDRPYSSNRFLVPPYLHWWQRAWSMWSRAVAPRRSSPRPPTACIPSIRRRGISRCGRRSAAISPTSPPEICINYTRHPCAGRSPFPGRPEGEWSDMVNIKEIIKPSENIIWVFLDIYLRTKFTK